MGGGREDEEGPTQSNTLTRVARRKPGCCAKLICYWKLRHKTVPNEARGRWK